MIEIAQRYLIEVCEEGNLDVLDTLVHPQVVLRDPLTLYASGRTALRERLLRDAASFCDVSIVIEDVAATGARLFVESTWRARHAGDFLGVAATDRRVVLTRIDTLHVAHGRIVELVTHYDLYALFQQLDALPRPDKLAAPKRAAPVLRLVP
jgi:predicted ester cyclase